MTKCEICKYQEDCPDIVEFNSVWCIAHRNLPKKFGNEYIEKQQLISFLEDKIKEYKDKICEIRKTTNDGWEISILKRKIVDFQEVLDFVRGGKDEQK